MSGAVLELGIVSRNSADIYKYREINEKKKDILSVLLKRLYLPTAHCVQEGLLFYYEISILQYLHNPQVP